jgi:hypothetical protein
MLTTDEKTLDQMEEQHPGIRETILRIEEATMPACVRCGSDDTARVGCGIVGRTIYISAATTKFKLIPSGPAPGRYFCDTCSGFFG